ncbi:prefoldin subunit beta [Methanohalophilus sp. RSK]|uniref:prefoldin subunit beta n=1 Tax=Methanohalophilus sp. RSK TaxID=2485783 RepID=UPI000F43DC16|nr:prefoldin subunit beta [Methanohalophilus sp. RSK]RNI14901.1 prefoldin subunit beta [Methanohalophilus sp. RSK]
MSSELPPQVQNQLAQLQQVQQQAQTLAMQKNQIESTLKETENALEELEQLSGDAVVYRTVGDMQIRTTKDDAIVKLKERNETLSLRLQSISRQDERISKRFNQLQEQVKQAMGTQGGYQAQ